MADCVAKVFEHLGEKHRFKIKQEHATTIQKSRCADSIVSNFNFTEAARRLLQHNRHFCDITRRSRHVRFSNRPSGVKRFQTIHQLSVNVARGLVLLFGIGTKALPSWDSKTRWNNLLGGLAVSLTEGQADMRTHLIHRPARDIIPPLGGARVSPMLLLLWPVPGSSGTQCHQPICGAGSQPADGPGRRSPFSSRGAWRSASPRP